MTKVKTFTCPLKIFHTKEELEKRDKTVNEFVERNNVKIISACDACTTDDTGATIGLVRVVTYE